MGFVPADALTNTLSLFFYEPSNRRGGKGVIKQVSGAIAVAPSHAKVALTKENYSSQSHYPTTNTPTPGNGHAKALSPQY